MLVTEPLILHCDHLTRYTWSCIVTRYEARAIREPGSTSRIAVVGGLLVTTTAALLPAQALRRLPAAHLLAEE